MRVHWHVLSSERDAAVPLASYINMPDCVQAFFERFPRAAVQEIVECVQCMCMRPATTVAPRKCAGSPPADGGEVLLRAGARGSSPSCTPRAQTLQCAFGVTATFRASSGALACTVCSPTLLCCTIDCLREFWTCRNVLLASCAWRKGPLGATLRVGYCWMHSLFGCPWACPVPAFLGDATPLPMSPCNTSTRVHNTSTLHPGHPGRGRWVSSGPRGGCAELTILKLFMLKRLPDARAKQPSSSSLQRRAFSTGTCTTEPCSHQRTPSLHQHQHPHPRHAGRRYSLDNTDLLHEPPTPTIPESAALPPMSPTPTQHSHRASHQVPAMPAPPQSATGVGSMAAPLTCLCDQVSH